MFHLLRRACIVFSISLATIMSSLRADDWPEWRGKGRGGVWNETGIVERFPGAGLKIAWRTPIRCGHSGPSVADEGVFVTDFLPTEKKGAGIERALCLDEKAGKILWSTEWQADYAGISYETGPRNFINNDRGELIIADLQPDGWHEFSRTALITPDKRRGGRREFGAVNWVYPACANRHIITRNEQEIIRASLDGADYEK